MPLPKNDPQGYGSAMTYARRYGLSALIGIVTESDDDGEMASHHEQTQNGGFTSRNSKDRTTATARMSSSKGNDPRVSNLPRLDGNIGLEQPTMARNVFWQPAILIPRKNSCVKLDSVGMALARSGGGMQMQHDDTKAQGLLRLLTQGLLIYGEKKTARELGDRSQYIGMSDIGKGMECLRSAVASKLGLTAFPAASAIDGFVPKDLAYTLGRQIILQRGHWQEYGLEQASSYWCEAYTAA